MGSVQEVVEKVLSRPARLNPLFKFWGVRCDFFNSIDVPAGAHFLDEQDTLNLSYDLTVAADGSLTVLLLPLYGLRGIKNYTKNPDPGGDYYMYPKKVPKTLSIGAVCRFKFPKISRERFYYWRIADIEKIEGIKEVVIQRLKIEPYRYG